MLKVIPEREPMKELKELAVPTGGRKETVPEPSAVTEVTVEDQALEEDGSDHYDVENILDHKKSKDGVVSYLVKWEGYGDKHNSWVKSSNFDDLDIIKEYWKSIAPAKKPKKQRKGRKRST
jgi:hypothetical protein